MITQFQSPLLCAGLPTTRPGCPEPHIAWHAGCFPWKSLIVSILKLIFSHVRQANRASSQASRPSSTLRADSHMALAGRHSTFISCSYQKDTTLSAIKIHQDELCFSSMLLGMSFTPCIRQATQTTRPGEQEQLCRLLYQVTQYL